MFVLKRSIRDVLLHAVGCITQTFLQHLAYTRRRAYNIAAQINHKTVSNGRLRRVRQATIFEHRRERTRWRVMEREMKSQERILAMKDARVEDRRWT